MNSRLTRRGFLVGVAASVVAPKPTTLVTHDLCSAYPIELLDNSVWAQVQSMKHLPDSAVWAARNMILAKAMNSMYGKMGNPPRRYIGGRFVTT